MHLLICSVFLVIHRSVVSPLFVAKHSDYEDISAPPSSAHTSDVAPAGSFKTSVFCLLFLNVSSVVLKGEILLRLQPSGFPLVNKQSVFVLNELLDLQTKN